MAEIFQVGVEQQPTPLVGRDRRRLRDVAEDPPQDRRHGGHLRRQVAQRRPHGLWHEPQRLLHGLGKGTKGRRPLLLVALAGQRQAAPRPREPLHLAGQPRLADAGLATEQHETAVAHQHAIQLRGEVCELRVAAHHGRSLLRLRAHDGGAGPRRLAARTVAQRLEGRPQLAHRLVALGARLGQHAVDDLTEARHDVEVAHGGGRRIAKDRGHRVRSRRLQKRMAARRPARAAPCPARRHQTWRRGSCPAPARVTCRPAYRRPCPVSSAPSG